MRRRFLVGLALLGLGWAVPNEARAGVVYNNWNYAIDSLNDASGGAVYELRGLALRSDGSDVLVAVSGSFPLTGVASSGALNGRISLGDFFFNFSNHNLDTAAKFTDPDVFGVRIASDNDSFGNTSSTPNTTTGVFSNITTAALASANNGYSTLQSYVTAGFGRSVDAMGDLEDNTNASGDVVQYLSYNAMQTNIASGTLLGGITLLDRAALAAQGLDFGHFAGADPSGNLVYGFSFSKSLLPTGDFTLHFFEECINDAVALKGSIAGVPEPSAFVLAFLGIGTIGGIKLRGMRKGTR